METVDKKGVVMKAICIIYDRELDPEVVSLLKGNNIITYTRFEGVIGAKTEADQEKLIINHACCIVLPDEEALHLFNEFELFKKKKLRKNFGVSIFLIPIEKMA